MEEKIVTPYIPVAQTIVQAFESQKTEGIVEKGDLHYINTTSTLTRLIQETGRFAENYASDLLISWRTVEQLLREKHAPMYGMPTENETHYVSFGIRESGVDGNVFLIRRLLETEDKNGFNRYIHTGHIYRRVYVMKIEISPAKNGLRASARTELRDLTHAFLRVQDCDREWIKQDMI